MLTIMAIIACFVLSPWFLITIPIAMIIDTFISE